MDDPLAEVRRQFRRRCSGDLLTLRAAMREPHGIPEASLLTMVHRLSGISGSLGFPQLGEAAAEVDRDWSRGEGMGRAGLERLEIALADVADSPGEPTVR